jgi:hypothetical protein
MNTKQTLSELVDICIQPKISTENLKFAENVLKLITKFNPSNKSEKMDKENIITCITKRIWMMPV